MFFYLVAKNHKLWKTIENTVISIWNCYLAVSNKCENSKPSLRESAWKMPRKRNRKSSEKCWKTTSTNMIQTLLKTFTFRLLFLIKILNKSMKNHQKTRFGNRLGKRYHFLYIIYTFWCPLGTLGVLPGHNFSFKMLRGCRSQAVLDAFLWFLGVRWITNKKQWTNQVKRPQSVLKNNTIPRN